MSTDTPSMAVRQETIIQGRIQHHRSVLNGATICNRKSGKMAVITDIVRVKGRVRVKLDKGASLDLETMHFTWQSVTDGVELPRGI